MITLDPDSYSRIIDHLYDGLYYVNRNRVIQYWNRAAERITGYAAAEVVGRPCSDNILTHVTDNGDNLCMGACPLAATLEDGQMREASVFLHHKDGHRVPVSVRVAPLNGPDGKAIGCVELFTDMSSLKSIETRMKELEEMALLDRLTGIANRRYIEKELSIHLSEEKRFQIPFGILFMDIDHFKKFNDTYGHDVGDQVLKYVANTLLKNSRPFDVMGRWGGEEFVGILRNVGLEQLEELGNRLRMLVESSYIASQDKTLHVTISMGATLMRHDDTLESLIKRADNLLYESKSAGRNRLTLG
jgi:diguanylate cyclase (GGDEF)-like protein/PAS domain S-box-containing protein